MEIDPNKFFYCGTCKCAAVRCDFCRMSSCSGSGCDKCHELFEEVIRLVNSGQAPSQEECAYTEAAFDWNLIGTPQK